MSIGQVVVGVIVVEAVDYIVVALHVSWHLSGFALSSRDLRCMAKMPGTTDLKNKRDRISGTVCTPLHTTGWGVHVENDGHF